MSDTKTSGIIAGLVDIVGIEEAARLLSEDTGAVITVPLLVRMVAAGTVRLSVKLTNEYAVAWVPGLSVRDAKRASFHSAVDEEVGESWALRGYRRRSSLDPDTVTAMNAQRDARRIELAGKPFAVNLSGVFDIDLTEGGRHFVDRLCSDYSKVRWTLPASAYEQPFRLKLTALDGEAFALLRLQQVWMPDLDMVMHVGGIYEYADPSNWPAPHDNVELVFRASEIRRLARVMAEGEFRLASAEGATTPERGPASGAHSKPQEVEPAPGQAIEILVPAVAVPSTVPATEPIAEHWKMRVQTQAAIHWRTLRQSGANPTVASILTAMVKWCRDNGVLTSRGITPSEGYLRTHVLGGKHWNPPLR